MQCLYTLPKFTYLLTVVSVVMSAVTLHDQRFASDVPSSTDPVGAVTGQSESAVQSSQLFVPVECAQWHRVVEWRLGSAVTGLLQLRFAEFSQEKKMNLLISVNTLYMQIVLKHDLKG